ncbi:IclR family transcriptional regulator [Arthrobacter antioxidans]|uniref:IclR family transcriptional regulator n=1 Tax=Arthrobacter antioxidans TaxID=2895818 RepID=UPI001FFF0638|nr:IclR family transcriptional regulator [Arthrobacter antioxidans]
MTNGSQSIDRAGLLLSLVVRSAGPISFTELVDRTGLARSTVSRLLQALERNGMLERNQDGHFLGGALFTHYANRFDRVESLATAAQPMLERIAEETGESVTLGVPRGDAVVHVAQTDSSYILGTTNWVGVDLPPHCSALGKVLYAFGALPLPTDPLEQRTPNTVPDVAALEGELTQVRERGYSLTRSELEEGLDALAAPVSDSHGRVLAAIGVSGPAFRLEHSHEEIGALLVAEAGLLSRILARRAQKEAVAPDPDSLS